MNIMKLFTMLIYLLIESFDHRMHFARFKPSPLFSDIRGRLGEMIAAGWKSGILYLKRMPTAVRNPNSSDQESSRSTLSVVTKAWFSQLSDAQRALWDTYALTEPGKYLISAGIRQLVGTNGGVMSGMNAYVLTNVWLISAGLAGVDNPPLVVTPPSQPTGLGAAYAVGTLTVTWSAAAIAEVGAVVRIHVLSFNKIFHKQIVGSALNTAETIDITLVRGAKGADLTLLSLEDSAIYIQVDLVNPTGGKSAGSETVLFTLA